MGSIAASNVKGFKQDGEHGPIKANVTLGGFDPGAIRDAVKMGIDASQKPIEDRLEINTKRLEALSEIQLAADTHKEALKDLQGASVIKAQRGVFGISKPVFGSLNGKSGTDYFSVTVNEGTKPLAVDISIIKTAEQDEVMGNSTAPNQTGSESDPKVPLNITGDLTFKHLDGTSPDIVFTFDGSENIGDINKIVNAQSSYTGVRASLVLSGEDFKLQFNSNEPSTPVTFTKNITAGDDTLIPDPRNTLKGATDIADNTANMGMTGDITFKHTDGVSADIVIAINAADSADTIAANIEAQSANTGVNASITGSAPNFKITFDAVDGKTPPTFVKNITVGDETQLPDSSTRTKSDLQAEVLFYGESSKHDTNNVKMPEMNLILHAITQEKGDPTKSVHLSIERSQSDASDKITAWAESSNNLMDVIDKYTSNNIDVLKLSQEEKENLTAALLASSTVTQDIQRFLTSSIQSKVNGTSMVDFGITMDKGRLVVDAQQLYENLLDDFDNIKDFFGFSETSTNYKFSTSSHPENIPVALIENEVTVTLSKDNAGILTATFNYPGSSGPSEAVEITEESDYISFKGKKENEFEGFKFFYDGTLANGEIKTTTMSFNQGLADKGIGYLEKATGKNGIFEKQTEAYKAKEKNHTDQIKRIQTTGARKIEALEKRLAAAIQAVQQILSISNQISTFEKQSYAAAAA